MKKHVIAATVIGVMAANLLAGCGSTGGSGGPDLASGGSSSSSAAALVPGGTAPGDPGSGSGPNSPGNGTAAGTQGGTAGGPAGSGAGGGGTAGGGPGPGGPGTPPPGQYPRQPKPPPVPDQLYDKIGGTATWEDALANLYAVCEQDATIREKFSVAECKVAADYLVTSKKTVVDVQPDASLAEGSHCALGWDPEHDRVVITSDGTTDCADALTSTRPKAGKKKAATSTAGGDGTPTSSGTSDTGPPADGAGSGTGTG